MARALLIMLSILAQFWKKVNAAKMVAGPSLVGLRSEAGGGVVSLDAGIGMSGGGVVWVFTEPAAIEYREPSHAVVSDRVGTRCLLGLEGPSASEVA